MDRTNPELSFTMNSENHMFSKYDFTYEEIIINQTYFYH